MKGVVILGSTGSIGVSTLDVLSRHPRHYRVVALAARRNVELMHEQCQRHLPECVVMVDAGAASRLRELLRADAAPVSGIPVLDGERALCELMSLQHADYVVAAIVGAAGLPSALEAARRGKRILLANKESLVMAGPLFMDAVAAGGAQLLPVDSEHNALFQCLPPDWAQHDKAAHSVTRLVLTASGGPFWKSAPEDLASVTPDQACQHPNWEMGRKISVDSATMMNKGLELIEACYLFSMPPSRIDVLIHPQSIVHSLVAYTDGSMLAQLGLPDMRTPIACALAWPDRIESGVQKLDLAALSRLDFHAPDDRRFPCLRLARNAMEAGGTAATILNAANEEAVAAFLDGRLGFDAIAAISEEVLARLQPGPMESLAAVTESDSMARGMARELLAAY